VYSCNRLKELRERYPGEIALPQVLICANNFAAVDATQLAGGKGRRVPEDVLVCGFDDAAKSRIKDPPWASAQSTRRRT